MSHGIFLSSDYRLSWLCGFKNEKTADRYIENWKTYYNFVKPHMALNGFTPSEMAGISIGADRNRWLTLIRLAQNY